MSNRVVTQVGPFFFVMPADARSNNIRILVNRAAVVRMDRAAVAATC